MTTKTSQKAPVRRKGRSDAAADMAVLAPMVIVKRMPSLMWEMATPHFASRRKGEEGQRAVSEKAAAMVEGYAAAQVEMLNAWSSLWLEAIRGDVPDAARIARKVQDITEASLEPAAKRVRANYRRLKSRNV